jgi:hypothetical protein
MLALCHLLAVPARYVSGHPLGHGGTHAWVEVVIPHADHAVAMPFDPCNGVPASARYLTVATGRDYADVPPTSGTHIGPSGGRLTTSRRVAVLRRRLSKPDELRVAWQVCCSSRWPRCWPGTWRLRVGADSVARRGDPPRKGCLRRAPGPPPAPSVDLVNSAGIPQESRYRPSSANADQHWRPQKTGPLAVTNSSQSPKKSSSSTTTSES